MKKAISIWAFAGKSVKESMELAKAAGYDGIELALAETGETSLESTPEEFAEIKEYAAKLGLCLPSVATGLFWSYPLTSNCEETRAKAVSIGIKELEMAKALGADAILIVPGAVGVDFVPGFDVVEYDVAYERSFAAFKGLKAKAEELQIHIGIENVWNKFLLSPLEMRAFIDKIDSPYVGSYFDVGNVVYSGYPEHWIKILGSRIRRVHFKDYRRDAGGLNGFVDLLAGDVNWPKVTEALKNTGYDGWVTAEMIPPYTHYPEQIIYNTSASMTKIING